MLFDDLDIEINRSGNGGVILRVGAETKEIPKGIWLEMVCAASLGGQSSERFARVLFFHDDGATQEAPAPEPPPEP